ncbi:MAG: DUF3368 domain-containing protein [Desertifilum sp.]|nr:DUF3368 domain-containing protein [Desertifilum sp.]
MIVVSDTSPLCYLLLINLVELLPQLYGRVIIPQSVCTELLNSDAPVVVKRWMAYPPDWLEIQSVTEEIDRALKADLVLLDDRAARQLALKRNLSIIGVLGILGTTAKRGLISFPDAIAQLQQTTFRASPQLIERLLKEFQGKQ